MITKDDFEALWRTCWGEARGESDVGMEAVAQVIVNRSRDRRWPGGIAFVCKQPWQFSCWNASDPNRSKCLSVPISDKHALRAVAAAARVLSGTAADRVKGANHYHATSIDPRSWADASKITARIGAHVFYRL